MRIDMRPTCDTATSPYGMGTFGSRSAVFGGGAVTRAAAKLRLVLERDAVGLGSRADKIQQARVDDHAAAELVSTPVSLVSMVVTGNDLAGIFIGSLKDTWRAAADLSSERHIHWVDEPFQRVLSKAPQMYDELWTAAKAMYKLDPAVADGGEIIVYAPHLATVSHF